MSENVIDALRAALGEQAVLQGEALEPRYCKAYFAAEPEAVQPLAVVRPRCVDEVATVLRLCHQFRQPLVTQGGMTGLSGGALPNTGELILSLALLRGIEEIDEMAGTMTLLAGTPLQEAQEAAAARGFMVAIDLGARGTCQIGGNLATNAGGNRVIRYGMAKQQALGLEAVLADGTVISSLNKMLKNNAGYDLKQLFLGSEGTLGVITRAVLKLEPLPNCVQTAFCAVDSYPKVVGLLRHAQPLLGGLRRHDVGLALLRSDLPLRLPQVGGKLAVGLILGVLGLPPACGALAFGFGIVFLVAPITRLEIGMALRRRWSGRTVLVRRDSIESRRLRIMGPLRRVHPFDAAQHVQRRVRHDDLFAVPEARALHQRATRHGVAWILAWIGRERRTGLCRGMAALGRVVHALPVGQLGGHGQRDARRLHGAGHQALGALESTAGLLVALLDPIGAAIAGADRPGVVLVLDTALPHPHVPPHAGSPGEGRGQQRPAGLAVDELVARRERIHRHGLASAQRARDAAAPEGHAQAQDGQQQHQAKGKEKHHDGHVSEPWHGVLPFWAAPAPGARSSPAVRAVHALFDGRSAPHPDLYRCRPRQPARCGGRQVSLRAACPAWPGERPDG